MTVNTLGRADSVSLPDRPARGETSRVIRLKQKRRSEGVSSTTSADGPRPNQKASIRSAQSSLRGEKVWHVRLPGRVDASQPGRPVVVLSSDRRQTVGDADLTYAGGDTVAILRLKPREALEVGQGYYPAAKAMLARLPDGTRRLVGFQLWGAAFGDDAFPLHPGEAPAASPIPPRPEVNLDPIPAGPIPPPGSVIGPRPRVITDRG